MQEAVNIKLISDGESALGIFSSENGYSKLRKVAFENWKKCPPPSARDEYWKYTRLNSVLGKSYLAAASPTRALTISSSSTVFSPPFFPKATLQKALQ